MKFILVGDPHFSFENQEETTILEESIISRLENEKPDFIVLLGDIMDKHEKTHVIPFNKACSFIERLASFLPTIVLIGNHDLRNNKDNQSGVHFFNTLKGKKDIYIIDRIQEIYIMDHYFLCCPYVPLDTFIINLDAFLNNDEPDGRDDIKDGIKKATNRIRGRISKYTCLFAHQEINGCNYNGNISSCSDKWPKDFPMIFSGHIHDYHKVANNLIYVGTPFQHKFDESPDKAIMHVTVRESFDIERIPLPIFPLSTVRIHVKDFDKTIIKGHKKTKIILEGQKEDVKRIMISKKAKKLKSEGSKIVPSFEINVRKRAKNSTKPYLEIVNDEIESIDDPERKSRIRSLHENFLSLL